MRKSVVYLLIVVACFSILCFSSCGVYDSDACSKTTFINDFYKIGGLHTEVVRDTVNGGVYAKVKIYPMENSVESVASLFDEDTELFYTLCEKRGDVNYCNRRVRLLVDDANPLYNPYSYLADDMVHIEVVCETVWDANHPAGSSLNDVAYFVGMTTQPFIDSHYEEYDYKTHKVSDFFDSGYPGTGDTENMGTLCRYPIDKPLTEVSEYDMRMLGEGHPGTNNNYEENQLRGPVLATLFLPYHAGDTPVKVLLTLTDSSGKMFTSEMAI